MQDWNYAVANPRRERARRVRHPDCGSVPNEQQVLWQYPRCRLRRSTCEATPGRLCSRDGTFVDWPIHRRISGHIQAETSRTR